MWDICRHPLRHGNGWHSIIAGCPSAPSCGSNTICIFPAQVSLPVVWAGKADGVGAPSLPWHRSSEHFTLNREHAELVTNDTLVNALFASRLCSDEDHDNRCTLHSL